jgi:hypothetical protein
LGASVGNNGVFSTFIKKDLTRTKKEHKSCAVGFCRCITAPTSPSYFSVSENSFAASRAKIGFTEAEASGLPGVRAERIATYEAGGIRPTTREMQILRGYALVACNLRNNNSQQELNTQDQSSSSFRATTPDDIAQKGV